MTVSRGDTLSQNADAPRYVDGPFASREEAWDAAARYAEMLAVRGLTPAYGVRVFHIPGHHQYAVYLAENDIGGTP